ncbi:MAG TPA: hypothetical protein DCS71_03820, partial [Flavobacteriales bacterium]|nr:hypothetical protein [Flavobacteriales bacterium]
MEIAHPGLSEIDRGRCLSNGGQRGSHRRCVHSGADRRHSGICRGKTRRGHPRNRNAWTLPRSAGRLSLAGLHW